MKRAGRFKRNQIWAVTAVFVLVVSMAIIGYSIISKPQIAVPPEIFKQLEFRPLIPNVQKNSDETNISVDAKTFEYNAHDKVLTFTVKAGNTSITMAEQAYPEILIFDKLVGTMRQYDEINTQVGKVSLTRPDSLRGGQTAVLSTYNGSSGVLLFARPEHDLNKENWQLLFNSLRQQDE
jgi:hypothetical protein